MTVLVTTTILDHLGQAAAMLLLLELMVILLIFLAIAGGLAFGLRWVEGKAGWAFEQVNSYLPLVSKYTRLGTDYVALPFIKIGGFAATVRETALSIRRRVRSMHAVPAVAAVPVPKPDDPTTEQSIEPVAIV